MHKIVVVGAGRIGSIHAHNAAENRRIELTGVVDAVESAANKLANECGTSAVSLSDSLSRRDVVGVVVASPTNSHLDICKRAAAAGKAIFCEKPLDLDVRNANEAADALRGARLFVGFNRRFDPNFQKLKKRLDDGEIGTVESIQITSNDPAPPPMEYVAISGGLFKDMSIHDFDMARWLLDEEPVSVFAAGGCLINADIGRLGDIDTARCILTTASGRLCVISNSRRSGYGYDQRIEVYGSGGMLRADNVRKSTVEVATATGTTCDPIEDFFLERYASSYQLEMDHFADILDGRAPVIGYGDGLAALALAERANESLLSGQPVRVP